MKKHFFCIITAAVFFTAFTPCNAQVENNNQKWLLESFYWSDGKPWIKYEYDAYDRIEKVYSYTDCNKIKETYPDCIPEIWVIETFTYNQDGELVSYSERREYYDGRIETETINFTKNGNRITMVSDKNSLYNDMYIEINAEGFPIKVVNQPLSWAKYLPNYNYYYDANGNVIKVVADDESEKDNVDWDDFTREVTFTHDSQKNPFYYCKTPKWFMIVFYLGNISGNNNTLTVKGEDGYEFFLTYDYTYDTETGFPLTISGDEYAETMHLKYIKETDNKSVTGVSLNKTTLALVEGKKEQLTAIIEPTYAINKAVTWKSDNANIAAVDATGIVTGVAKGTAIITVTTAEGNFTASCSVEVTEIYCKSPIASGTTGTLTWRLCEDGTLTISGVGAMPNYSPDGAPWYSVCSNITALNLSNEITTIGNYAFYGCSNISSVTIHEGVTSIGYFAFYGCSKLETVNFNAISCSSVGSNNYNFFYNCTSIKTLNIGANVKTIPDYAFNGCSGISLIDIPNSVTSIGEAAFYNCSNITSVTIPEEVTSIGSGAFSGCTKLETVYFNAKYCTKVGISYISNAFYNLISIKTLYIGAKVKFIPDYAFSGCSGIALVNIPNSVTSIGEAAFYNCSNITSVTIPEGVTSIGSWAFSGCSRISSLTIPNSVITIGKCAFQVCAELANAIIIPNGITSIGDQTFYGCAKMPSVAIPGSVTVIGTDAFYGCTRLTSLSIPASVNTIGDYAFSNCTGLRSITSLRPAPPAVSANTFSGVNVEQCRLYVVPEGLMRYQTTPVWKDFFYIQAIGVICELASLSVSNSTLSPAFNAGITSYTCTVPYSVNAITISAAAAGNGTVSGIGVKNLVVGVNNFNIVVTAEGGSATKTYTVAVTRQEGPSVTGVTVSPETVAVQKGATYQLTATVAATGGASQAVTWSVSGNTVAATRISSAGVLTIDAGETAAMFTVTATSDFDKSKRGTASVTVTQGSPLILSGTVAGAPSGTMVQLFAVPSIKASLPTGSQFVGFAYTDVFKNYQFTNLPPGIYVVIVVIPGYESQSSEPVNLAGGGISGGNVNFTVNDNTKTITPDKPNMITGTNDDFAPDLKIYPNPFTGELHITGAMVVETWHAASLQIQVINSAGIIVHTQMITSPGETIRLEHLPPGVYFLRLIIEGKEKTVKVVKIQ